MRTFAAVFPDASLWESATGDFLILGTASGMGEGEIAERMLRAWQPVDPGSALGKLGIAGPEDLLKRRLLDPAGMKRLVGDGPLNTDDRPLVCGGPSNLPGGPEPHHRLAAGHATPLASGSRRSRA